MGGFLETPVRWDEIFSIAAIIFISVGVLALVAWSRYLYHKEMMRLAEGHGDLKSGLEVMEVWRTRRGILWGIRVSAVGAALIGAAVFWGRTHFPPDAVVGLAFVGTLLLVIGGATLVAYAVWSRKSAWWSQVGESARGASREDDE